MRKKLYKAGKMWVAGMAATAGLAVMVNTGNVSADTNTSTTVTAQTGNNNQDNGANTNPLNAANNQNNTVQVDNNGQTSTIKNNPTQQSGTQGANANATSQTTVTIVTTNNRNTVTNGQNYISGADGDYKPAADGSFQFILRNSGQPVKGLATVDGAVQFFNDNGNQVKGQWEIVDNNVYYFDANSGNALTGVQTIDGQLTGFENTGIQVKNQFLTDSNGISYYFGSDGKVASGLQTVNGKTYLIKADGTVTKGGETPTTINGVQYYFDSLDGHATIANANQYQEGLVNLNNAYTPHNQIVSDDSTNIDTVNGYVTASSWYQPKDILVNGQNWTPSTSSDRRPLLMSWWPNKETEVNYINFMLGQNIISGNQVNISTSSQDDLNQAVQNIQVAIEKRITSTGSTDWLKTLINQFIVTQPGWNVSSESPSTTDGFQGGTLAYQNSTLTPWANSNYRYLNRTPSNQTGDNTQSLGGYEFLLANDIDNSNPTVQAEQLNWLYYLLNFGSITDNNSNANFDGYRVDAVDNVDADLLQIAADYMKAAYGVNQNNTNANQHLSILEDWDYNDFQYTGNQGSNQLTMDFKNQVQLVSSLTQQPQKRDSMIRFLQWYNVNRAADNTENEVVPNYSFLRAHDSQVQTVIAQIIADLYPNADALRPTADQLANAFKVYDADQTSTNKKYTMYNVPAAYAMLLTDKDTVPRVYYGDLYTDDGQYMANKSPYYDAISTLLQDRVKYVAGGQTMATGTWNSTQNTSNNRTDVLTTVRFGKGLMNASDQDLSVNNQRTDGMGVIISNNPNLQLGAGEEVVLHMGAAHANQKFRAALLSTSNGLQVYNSDAGAPIVQTDANGDLIFDSSWVYGISDPQVSGYLAVWVPVGASADQDARTSSSSTSTADGATLHSNAALDSNVIYEGFSNFQAMPTQTSEYTNVKIAQNADLFKSWGITSFQFAPQYRSSTDSSFIDSIIKNGYSFTDRYDLGFDSNGQPNPTKYGTAQQLRAAIEAVHAAGIQAMADWVPDQIYNLPNQEMVTVTRTDTTGKPVQGASLSNSLYVANTMSSGTDWQSVYGGAFLSKIKQLYPWLFTTKQISTGQPIDGDTLIKQWSAKYLNGTNILGRGDSFVLNDSATHNYFTTDSTGKFFLPKQLTNQTALSGFEKTSGGVIYYSPNGYQAFSNFVQDDNGNYYYFDQNGYMVTGVQHIDGNYYYFLTNGILLRNHLWSAYGNTYYSTNNGQTVQGLQIINGLAYDFGNDGTYNLKSKPSGYYNDGQNWRWYENGQPYTGFQLYYGAYYYFVNGFRQDNQFVHAWGLTYYVGNDGRTVEGIQLIDGNVYDFGNDSTFYLKNKPTGYSNYGDGWKWYQDGQPYTGFRFYMGTFYYFVQGVRQVQQWENAWGLTYYVGADGRAVQGVQNIDDKLYYFGNDSTFNLRTNQAVTDGNQKYYANADGSLTPESGYIWDGSSANGGYRWYEDGQLYTGFRYYMGTYYWFVDGVRQNEGWRYAWGLTYWTDANGRAVQGMLTIAGQNYNFGTDGTYYLR